MEKITLAAYVGVIASGAILGPDKVKPKIEKGVQATVNGATRVTKGVIRGGSDIGDSIENKWTEWFGPKTTTPTAGSTPSSAPASSTPTPATGTAAPPIVPPPATPPSAVSYVLWNPRIETLEKSGMLGPSIVYVLKDETGQNPKEYSFAGKDGAARFVNLANSAGRTYFAMRGKQLDSRLATSLAEKIDTIGFPYKTVSDIELTAAEQYLSRIDPEELAKSIDEALR